MDEQSLVLGNDFVKSDRTQCEHGVRWESCDRADCRDIAWALEIERLHQQALWEEAQERTDRVYTRNAQERCHCRIF